MGLSPDHLISNGLTSHAWNALGEDNENLGYFIYQDVGSITFDDGSQGETTQHSDEAIAFIRDIFIKLDPILDLDFQELNSWDNSVFDIYALSDYSEWDRDTVGEVNPQGYGSNSYFDIYWRNGGGNDLSEFDANTIIHEIGHGLGLSHPHERPFDPEFNTDDTVMSYNESPDGWDTWFSDADINALQTIWGEEDDSTNSLNPNSGHVDDQKPQGFNLIEGNRQKNQLNGSDDNDIILGHGNGDKINGKAGDDIIDPGINRSWRISKLKGGQGHDTFVIKDGYWSVIQDFNPLEDKIDSSGLKNGLQWDFQNGKTFIWGKDDYEVARIKGYIDLGSEILL